jgi:hypothetical protein
MHHLIPSTKTARRTAASTEGGGLMIGEED